MENVNKSIRLKRLAPSPSPTAVQRQELENGLSDTPLHPAHQPIVKQEIITPEMAQRWLSFGGRQRALKAQHVLKLSMAIQEGRWDEHNGETIKITTAGQVVDGQHRLHAIVLAGQPVTSLVVHHVPEHSFATIDTGRPRAGADILSIAGYKDTNSLHAATRLVMAYQYALDNPESALVTAIGKVRPTPDVALAFMDENEELQEKISQAREFRHIASVSTVGAARFLIEDKHKNNPEVMVKIRFFFDSLLTGAELSVGDPILTLRNFLMQPKKQGAANRMNGLTNLLAIIRAWNNYINEIALMRMVVSVSQKAITIR